MADALHSVTDSANNILGLIASSLPLRNPIRSATDMNAIILRRIKPFDALVVLGTNIFVAFYKRPIDQRIGRQILLTDVQHTIGDIWVTLIVIAGMKWQLPRKQFMPW